MLRNRWTEWIGISGRNVSEWVDGMARNTHLIYKTMVSREGTMEKQKVTLSLPKSLFKEVRVLHIPSLLTQDLIT
jgi:hypothetical protein